MTIAPLLISGCQYVPGTETNKLEAAKEQIASRMKDPASVLFTDVRMSVDGAVCGKLNAKNGFGAYGGYEGFLYRGFDGDLNLESGSLTDNPGIAASEKCQFRKLYPVCMSGRNVLSASVELTAQGDCQREAKEALDADYRQKLETIG